MRRLTLASLALSLLALAFARPVAADEPSADALRESLRATEAAFAKAFADDDLDAFASFIDEDAVFLAAKPLRGKEQAVARWSTLFGRSPRPFSWEPKRWEVNPSGTMGMTSGPVFDTGGKQTGTFSSVWKRQADGTWKIIFDGGSDCPPAP